MNQPIRYVFQGEFLAARPQVPLRVPVALQVAVDGGQQSEAADVELAVAVEERSFYVLLNYVGALGSVDYGV